MKDIICNAHYCPAYLYDTIWHLGLPDHYVKDRYSERFDEEDEYRTWHWPGSYTQVGHLSEEYRAEFITPGRAGCVTPNYPIEKYDTVARKEWDKDAEPGESWVEVWGECYD